MVRRVVGAQAVIGLLALSFLGMAGASAVGRPVAYAVAAVVGYLVEWRLPRLHGADAALRRVRFSVAVRFALRDALLVLLALGAHLAAVVLAAAAGWAVAAHGGRVTHLALARVAGEWGRLPVEWRNLDVPGLRTPRPPLRRLRVGADRRTLFAGAAPAAGVVAMALGLSPVALWTLTAVAGVAVAVPVVAALVDLVALRGHAGEEEIRTRVRAALEAYEPEVVAYLSGDPKSTFAINQWLPTLEKVTPRCVVVLRQRHHLDRLDGTTLPVLCLPRAVDLEAFVLPSMKAALYPMNGMQNNHLIRHPGIADVFVGHGDSDKGSSANPLSRVYDEVWVAGRAGRDRYRLSRVGVRDDQVREVGRPQLAAISRDRRAADRGGPFTVLYAPTWEGFYAALEYSSLKLMGRALVARLLDTEGVRVLYKPHPTTGARDIGYARADADVRRMITRAGGGHAVVDGATGLYDAFNAADLLISDISSVVSDFLYSRKPYIVTNPRDEDDAEFRRTYPSAAGAHLLGPDCAPLGEFLADARGPDVLRDRRERTARYLLGDDTDDPVAVFDKALTDLVARWAARPVSRSV